MAKTSSIHKNLKRIRLVEKYKDVRKDLKKAAKSKTISMEERYALYMKLAALPKDSSRTRVRNRCTLTGRSRGFYRKFGLSRICIRELGSNCMIPGLLKASW